MLSRAAAIFCIVASLTRAASADDLDVLAASAVKKAVEGVPAQVETATGDHVRFTFGTAGGIHDKAAAGTDFDIVILPPAPLDDLSRRGLVVPGSRRDLGTVRLAAAVRSGAVHPALENVAELKDTLLAAPSIGLADPATGATTGIYLAKLFQQLGMADALRSKVKVYADGLNAMAAVARGEVAIGLGQMSEITPVQGVELVGPLPETVQLKTIYAAGLGSKVGDKPSARKLLDLLTSPAMAAAFRANGFDAGP